MKHAAGSVGDGFAGVVDHILEQRLVSGAEFVVRLRVLALGKRRVALKKVTQIRAAALDKMCGEPAAVDRLVRTAQVIR